MGSASLIGYIPKRLRRYLDPAAPGRKARIRFGQTRTLPASVIDSLDRYAESRGLSALIRHQLLLGLTADETFSGPFPEQILNTVFNATARGQPITIAFTDLTWTALTTGIAFEFGSSASGLTIYFDAAQPKLRIDVGDGTSHVELNGFVPSAVTEGVLVAAVNPATGEVKAWLNGTQVGYAKVPPFAAWTADSNGSVGDVDGTAFVRAGVTPAALANGGVIGGDVLAFVNALPEGF